MKFRIGDNVIFIKRSYKEDAWPLNNYEKYTITNRAFDRMGIDTFYAVKDNNGKESTWYIEDDFLTLKEYRKLKIKKLNER